MAVQHEMKLWVRTHSFISCCTAILAGFGEFIGEFLVKPDAILRVYAQAIMGMAVSGWGGIDGE
jgi:hypothetical protein